MADTEKMQSSAKEKPTRVYPRLISYEALPQWAQDNKYIYNGYRPISNSSVASFRSLLKLHNETINIYTHFIPAVAFLVSEKLVVSYLRTKYPQVAISDILIFSIFIFTAVVCLSFSTCYHTLMNHSMSVESFWLRIDFSGIILLILGDFASGVYMTFWCEPLEKRLYWIMISILGIIDICILLSPRFQGLKWRKFRVYCFVGTGFSGLAPLAHGAYLFGFSQMMKQSGMPYYIAEGVLHVLGVVVYATRFPECMSPGRFDIYGSSHQIFHILVVLATVTQLVGILQAYDYNYNHRSCLAHA